MSRVLNIAIVGCGVGGLTTALLLARDGHRVTMFDRFPQPEPVGSGLLLQPTGLAVLGRLGLRGQIESRGDRVGRLHGLAGQRLVLSVDYTRLKIPDAWAIGIHRSALFDVLYSAALGAGASVLSGRAVTGTASEESGAFLSFDEGPAAGPFDLVIDSSGSRSPLVPGTVRPLAYGALWATVPNLGGAALEATLTQRYRAARQMAGLLPVGRLSGRPGRSLALFWSIRVDALDGWRNSGTAAWRAEWSELWPDAAAYAEAIQDIAQFQFAAYHHRTFHRPVEGRLVHIGDAWHSTSPQLGQGANMALLDAWALARSLREQASVEVALEGFVAARRSHVRLYQMLSLALTPLYQSDHLAPAVVRDRLIAPTLSLKPFDHLAAAGVAGLIGKPLARLGLD